MDVRVNQGWADRLGPGARTIAIIVAVILGVFAIGMVVGFSAAVIEDGQLPTKPVAYLIFATMIALVALVGYVLLSLFRAVYPARMSGFDRRYWRMWAILFGLSIPVGMGIAALGFSENTSFVSMVLSSAPIAPRTAILSTILLSAVMIISMVIYFRAIDDHEERAYLWGSNVAFHFVVLAFPVYWLLARGGLVPTLTIGSALLIILVSCVVQATVWALFKFR